MNGIFVSLYSSFMRLYLYALVHLILTRSLGARRVDGFCLILLSWTQLRFKGTNFSKDRVGKGKQVYQELHGIYIYIYPHMEPRNQ